MAKKKQDTFTFVNGISPYNKLADYVGEKIVLYRIADTKLEYMGKINEVTRAQVTILSFNGDDITWTACGEVLVGSEALRAKLEKGAAVGTLRKTSYYSLEPLSADEWSLVQDHGDSIMGEIHENIKLLEQQHQKRQERKAEREADEKVPF